MRRVKCGEGGGEGSIEKQREKSERISSKFFNDFVMKMATDAPGC